MKPRAECIYGGVTLSPGLPNKPEPISILRYRLKRPDEPPLAEILFDQGCNAHCDAVSGNGRLLGEIDAGEHGAAKGIDAVGTGDLQPVAPRGNARSAPCTFVVDQCVMPKIFRAGKRR